MAKLLIVDDNEQSRYLLQTLLRGHGYEVVAASDGLEALEKARCESPDIIVTDILMPRMDGFTLCRQWKRDESLSEIPLVFYTATYTDPRDEEFALSLGAHRFIVKPQEPDVLLRAIEEVVSASQAGQPLYSPAPVPEEVVYFKEYNEALIRKLEDKLVEIESANAALENEVAERKKAEEMLRASEKELRARTRIANVFLTATDDEMYSEVLKIVLELTESESGLLGYIDEDETLIAPGVRRGSGDLSSGAARRIVLPRDVWKSGVWGSAIEERRALRSTEGSAPALEGGVFVGQFIVSPIINRDEVIGVLQVADKKGEYAEEDIQLLGSICSAIAPILNARLQRERQAKEREFLENQLRQAQKMEAIGRLAGGVAHDFNNIIQAIMGYASFALEDASPDKEQRNHLLQVIKGAEHAAGLTRQLLAFSRQQVLLPRNIDLNDLVQGVLKMIRRVIGEDIEIDFISGRSLGIICADPSQIEQVILNICINARDAMPDGGRLTLETEGIVIDEAYCEAHPWTRPGSYVVLKIADTGMGMDEKTRRQVFDPFFTTKEVGKGTGLGLATVYGIVKQHDGFIHLYSEVSKGTIFRIYLPIVEQSAIQPEALGPEEIRGGSETILFAEDDAALRVLGIRILEKAGYAVLPAVNGEEAVEILKKHREKIALALLDVIMPKMGGRAIYDAIRAISPQTRVLFTSGYIAGDVGIQSILNGPAQLIQKPYEPRALLRKVREILDAKEYL